MSDEPIFEAEESGLWSETGGSSMPDVYRYAGSVPESELPASMPTIYLDAEVAATLQSEGQRSIEIDKEVAGILLGTRSEDNQFIRVSHIAIAQDEDSSPVHFKFTYSVWDDLIDQMESLSREAGTELLLVAWYHTHPNMSVFLSRYDLRTHRDFDRPYQFALVLAPQRGTEQTSVGFFCNRDEGTPLLPGLRLFGGDQQYTPPWTYETEPNEDFEEGEGGADSDEEEVVVVHQLGAPGRENPEWLTLGSDPVEGAVLPTLEGMTAAILDAEHDRIGVLLGTKTEKDHINITRVRFLGRTSADLGLERGELLGALRFMAETFPATADPKILGIVRIVAPRRLGEGSVFDPEEHNLGIAELLAEVGYDVRAVPFQVGLVLLPGLRSDRLLFQVFAQRTGTRPVYMTSFRASAPQSRRPGDYYEALKEPVLVVEATPALCLPPGMGAGQGIKQENLADTLRDSVGAVSPTPDAETDRLLEPSPVLAQISEVDAREDTDVEGGTEGIDWDRMAAEEARGGRILTPLLTLGLVVGVVLVAVVLYLTFGTTFGGGGGDETAVEEPVDSGDTRETAGNSGRDPYQITMLGCRGGTCAPFPQDAPHVRSVDLVRVVRQEAYLEQSLKPIEVWLERPGDPLIRVRLERRAEGQDTRVYSVRRRGRDWTMLWANGEAFEARLLVLPQGVPINGEAALSSLRVERELVLRGPVPLPEEGESTPTSELGASTQADPGLESSAAWNWRGAGSSLRVSYDSTKRAFKERLLVSGGSPSGTWVIAYEGTSGSSLRVRRQIVDPEVTRGNVDLTREVTQLMREPAVLNDLRSRAGGQALTAVSVRPPGEAPVLRLTIEASGQALATSVKHKVCIMMAGPFSEGVAGRSRMGSEGTMRPTFEPGSPGECGDGGNTGRWIDASFGPGRTLLQFIYEGDSPDLAPSRGVVQKYRLPERWSTIDAKCLGITIHLGEGGWRQKAPTVKALYKLEGGRCI